MFMGLTFGKALIFFFTILEVAADDRLGRLFRSSRNADRR
jgi:hypothetical protein